MTPLESLLWTMMKAFELFSTVLEDLGYVVDGVGTRKEGIAQTIMNFYNLVFVDVHLPGMEGPQVLEKMRNTIPKMRKIIITGYPSMQNVVETLNRGAHSYIMKPFGTKKIIETVEEQLKLQDEEKKFSQEKITEYVLSRVGELKETIPAKTA
jgi:DNA-binding NtrC family response regulator